ncbi:alpha/beta hydrolase-fold protein [Microbacterium sp. HD4P20]|uniref:alpha/beta hydrolase n=1 Tax=Microbacterium sp. HD4P20 TaxID=2864874 RepID=UPI001C642EE3|nr:alpha/beta hydrolase-fold protein [Microbacterium sp. HD4P20]MCP2637990.1 alpha/beta hydrolase-fold protein [Microbacterium sp. HD4P20]
MSSHQPLDSDTVLWSAAAEDRAGRPLLVLLHGYGSDERDLFALVPHLPEEFVIAAVRAPLAPPFPTPGYSWYAIDDLDGRDPAHVTASAHRLLAWTDAVAGPVGSEPGPTRTAVGLLGFSQGGAVALQAMRLDPHRFAFAVNLSGYATPGALPRDAELAEVRPPVFWGRGTQDDVIPSFLVEHTIEWLPRHTDLSGRVYPGLTHSVSEQELADVRVFLEKRLADLAPPSA